MENKKINKNEIDGIKQSLFSLNKNNDSENKKENLAEIINAWLDDKHIHTKTRLNHNQIIILTILKTLYDKYKSKTIKNIIDNFVRYQISEGGQSAKELVEILKNRNDIQENDDLLKKIQPFIQ